jgi:GntR family transcriptional regulator, transcriptional repressor for pyruvate dehydrogenase complex
MDNGTRFTPARVGRASEDIALQIEAAILSGEIRPGERLPSERDLQGHFRTGRGVIREALGALKQKGVIEVRKGAKGGAFVRQVEVSFASESLALFLAQRQVPPENLIEFRESIDHTITLLAIARGTREEKKSLVRETRRLAEAMDAPEMDENLLVEMDRALNLQFARMAKNPIFEWIMAAIQLGFSSLDHALYETPGYREKTVSNWVETAEDIAAEEPLKALSSVGSHYLMLRRCIRERAERSDAGSGVGSAECLSGPWKRTAAPGGSSGDRESAAAHPKGERPC